MIGKKINQLATELAPASTDLTIIGNPTTGVSKKITLAQLGAIFSGAVSFYTNYASFPATGTLDVIFCAKDTKKLYLWSGSAYVEVFPSQALLDTYQLRSEKGNANGYASLDSSGKVPISQLPSSIMEYKGTWSAATNTPTLANGTGDTGDVYICNAAGSVNFGAGSITFAVGDYVIYSGSIWQRSSGAVGTVTSVAASITGNAIGITGSPVTTSGTLAFAFAGTSAQYVNGAGNLTTFPSIITQAQNLVTEVYNKTGATLTKGTVVYINSGQGNLPAVTKAIATGDSTSAQTYGIVQADITNMNNGYVVVAGRITDLDTQAYTEGTQLYLSSTTAGAYTSIKQYAPAHLVYVGIVVRAHPTQGVIEVKIQNGYELDELHNVAAQTPTNNDGLFWEASTSLWKNKSLATIIGGTPVFGSGTQNRLARWSSTSGELINSGIQDTGGSITNVLTTAGQYAWQFNGSTSTGLSYGALIVAGTNASDVSFKIMNASATSAYLYMWGDGRLQVNNIPNATTDTDTFLVSDSGVIKYRTGTQLLSDIGGQPAGTYVTSVGLSVPTGFSVSGSPVTSSGTLALSFDTGYSLPTNASQTNWDTAYTNRITSATSPISITSNVISIAQASGSTSGYLSSTDWTTFNNKQNALTNPVTGTGTTNYLPKFTGTSTIGNSVVYDDGTNIGIGTASPLVKLHVNGTGTQYFRLSSSTNSTFQQMGATSGGTFLEYKTLYRLVDTDNGTRLTLDASGNLGLGVTPSAWFSATKALQINGGSIYAANTYTFVGSNTVYTSAGDQYINTGFATVYGQLSGEHRWYTAPSGTAGNAISFTQAMTLNASGNLSLGNTNDTYKLDVSGTGRFSNSASTILTLESSNGSGFTAMQINSSGAKGLIGYGTYLTTDGGVAIRTAASIPFTIAIGGGTPTFSLASTGAATFSSSVTAAGGIRTTGANGFSDTDGTSTIWVSSNWTASTPAIAVTTNHPLMFLTNNTERMRITSGGKVCINTTTVNNGAFLNIGSSGSSRGDDLMTIFNPAVYGIRFLSATGGGSPNTSIAHMLLGNDGTTGRSINASGTINASGADYAEYMTKAVSENIAKGDIIGVDANGLLTNIYADAISFVVKSTDPSYVGGDKWGANLKGAELETARQKVDRVAFSGQVPCNVLNAQVGDYIIPINVNGKIKGEAVTNPTFEQYQISVGKVWKIMEDGRAWIAIKIG